MRVSRSVGTFIFLVCLSGMVVAASAPSAQAPARSPARSVQPAPAILPQQFGGWEVQAPAQTSTDPSLVDAANAAVLKEYGFSDAALASYTRDDGRTLKIKAARFADASGAFGAYTFYLQPEMTPVSTNQEDRIGDQAAFLGQRVLFYRGHVLIDAQFSQESAMSGEQMRELAKALPRPDGSSANLPGFIEFLPHKSYLANTQKYVMGPLALAALAAPVSADLVDFNASAEVTLARYDTPSGEATLMLISYPTPKLAADHLLRINAARQPMQPQAGASSGESAGSFSAKRTGPIIAIASGDVTDSDAKSLLGMVNYEASVTWSTPASDPQVHQLYTLILNIVVLCGILGALAVVAGVAFGGIRILMKRWYPDRVFDRPEHMEFISLRLTETVVIGTPQTDTDRSHPAPENPA